MASHAERLKQSPCFIKSHEKPADAGQLKPGGNSLTCITCHNPHVSVKATNTNVFNDACIRCHSDSEKMMNVNVTAAHTGIKNWNNCVSCHMPLSGASDIPHVSVHDHFIRKPVAKKELAKIKQFLGLYAVNEKQPDALTRAQAYINQYEKFEQEPFYLDSALLILNNQKTDAKNFHALVQIYFIKRSYGQIISLVNAQGGKKVLETLIRTKSYDNRDAWTAYRIAEAFYAVNELQKSKDWFSKAVALAPFNLDFRNKYGSVLVALNEPDAAEREFVFVMKENPKYVAAYTNLGYLTMARGFPAEALRLYQIGLKLDPDNESLLLNLAAYYLQMRNNQSAAEVLKKIIKINPGNVAAKNALQGLTT
jgi:tetratricopeptide (TPR) repeat protein